MKKYTEKHAKQLNQQIQDHFPHLKQITPDMKISREGVSRLVMLDRYANKDINLKTLTAGDLVIANIKNDPKFPTMGIAMVQSIEGNEVTIKVEKEYTGQIDEMYKNKNGVITINKSFLLKPLEIYFEQIAKRVASHLSEDEKDNIKDTHTQNFYKYIVNDDIVPAGRVLYGAGSSLNVTYFNCFVLPMPKDSRQGISDHRYETIEIMSRGGGVGTNGSTLRPKNAVAISVGSKSAGAVSWLNDLSSLTNLIQQGGSRRGAQMIMLQDWHPDIIEFIISKMQNPKILKWISDNFQDPEIISQANDKLLFKPFSAEKIKLYTQAVKFAKTSQEKQKYKDILNLGGEYSVRNPEFMSGANISVGITKEFMEAVKNNENYSLRFPDIAKMPKKEKEFYDKKWHEIGDVREWERNGYHSKVYKTIKAKELFDLINFCATYSAEPGVFFIDKANDMTSAKSYGQKVVCTNPCGEQPLAPYSVCNLSAINLANMINKETGEVNYNKIKKVVATAIRLQDNIIDKTNYFLEKNKTQALGERRIGMGVMGLHDLLIWKGMKYGSNESIELIDKIFKLIATVAYSTSADLGKEKGMFKFQTDVQALLKTGFIKSLPKKVKDKIQSTGGLRNSHLLTIAPTGSTGTMIGVSTGLEPYFAFKYYRSGRLGKFMEVDQNIVTEWKEINNFKGDILPEFFTSAMDITPEEHVDVQTTIQRWIDSSISKTVNAPKGYSVKQVEKIYLRLYETGAKGGTVYVDGSRDAQVLSITNDDEEINQEIKIEASFNDKLLEIKEKASNIMNNKQDRDIGTELGDICPICKEGIIEDLGGCTSCTICGVQLKCGL